MEVTRILFDIVLQFRELMYAKKEGVNYSTRINSISHLTLLPARLSIPYPFYIMQSLLHRRLQYKCAPSFPFSHSSRRQYITPHAKKK